MKKILSALVALYLLIPSSHAQNNDEVRPPAIGISFFLNDFVTPERIRTTSLSSVFNKRQFARMRDMSPGFALSYFKGLRNHIDFAGTLGGSFLRYPLPGKTFSDNSFLLEGTATANFKMTTEKYWVQPYLIAGIGAHKYRSYFGAFVPLGLGMKVNFFDEAHLFITSQYRIPVTNETANYHLQHSIGIAGALNKKKPKEVVPVIRDRDGDGVVDDVDACPDVAGPASLQGCPDRDGDGIADKDDKCPDVKGIAQFQGCPDRDGDGIQDSEDKCPDVKGIAKYQGCPIPDTDKDGINDEEDKCPTVPGVARYQGCPVPDTDGDGVNDEEDRCPNLKGVRENQGCPIIPEDVKKRVNVAAQNILFVTGSAKLQSKSFKGLNEVAKIMQENPEMELAIDGHTDNVGSDEFNQKLSDDRAASVKAYLVSKGVDESRIAAQGHGETMPIADNKTAAGRQKNRRSELTLSYFK